MSVIKVTASDGTIIRDAIENDLILQDAYFEMASDEFLLRLGVDPTKVRGHTRDFSAFRELQKIPLDHREIHLFVFERDGKVVGSSTVKSIRFGESAEIHGHIYDEKHRAKGNASKLLREYLELVFETFQLKTLIAEPSVQNTAPNRLLEKFGAKLVDTYDVPAMGILLARRANRYEISRSLIADD